MIQRSHIFLLYNVACGLGLSFFFSCSLGHSVRYLEAGSFKTQGLQEPEVKG